MSQEALSKKAGIPRPNLAAIEKGKREPSLPTLRALASSLGIDAGTLVNGVAPIHFGGSIFSRRSQELIVKAIFSRNVRYLNAEQKLISSLLSNIVRNKINSKNKKFSKGLLKNRGAYIKDWLLLKAAIESPLVNKLLAQIDKYI